MALQIVNNIPNTTVEVLGNAEDGYTLRVTAINGAQILDDPYPTYSFTDAQFGSIETYDFDSYTPEVIEVAWGFFPDETQPVTINGASEGGIPQPTVDITNNIAGSTETHNFDGETLVINLSFDSNKRLYDGQVSYTASDSQPKTVPLDAGAGTASVTITDADFDQPFTLSGEVDDYITIYNELQNCEVTGLRDYYRPTDTVELTLQANTGYVFEADNMPYLLLSDTILGEEKIYFTAGEDTTTASLTFDLGSTETYDYYYLQGGAVEGETPITSGYGAINVYIVTNENLEDFARARFSATPDFGDYVNRLQRIFADVQTGGSTTIACGNTNTGVQAQTPTQTVLTLDFGKCSIPAHNADATDYESEIQVFLPFHGYENLPADFAGKYITLQYVIDIITGGGVAKLSVDGVMFAAYDITPSQDVIYRTLTQSVNVGTGDNFNNMLHYGIEPFVVCKWYDSHTPDRNNTAETGIIGGWSGFLMLDDISPIHTAEMLATEQEMIYRALTQTGVYVE